LRLVRVGEPRLVWSRRASDGVDELTFNLKGTAVAVVEGLRMGKRRTVRLMCAVSGETTATVDMDADVWRLDSLSDAELVLSCGDGTVRLCDSVDLEEIARFRDHADGGEDEILLSLMAMDPGRTVVVTATGEDVYAPVVARGLRLGTQGTMTMSPPSDVTCIAVSPDGGSFAYSIMGGWSFVQWRGSGGQLVRSDRPVDVRAVAIAIDEPNGCFIVVGAFGELQTFGLDTGRLESFRTIQLLNQEYGLDAAVVLAEQGRVVVVEERMVQLVRFNSDDTVALRTEEAYAVPPVVSSPDGSLVATASSDAAIRLWRTTDGRRVSILRRHRDAITGLRFSSDGQRLISADEGGVVCAWDVSDAYLRGAELTEWIRNRTGEGVLFLEENEDLLLRDVLREGDSRDVIGALDRLDQ
jgi:WD40 repeat protein